MKKLKFTLIAAAFVALAGACKHDRHVVIADKVDNHYNFKIEYHGRTLFNDDRTAIESITPNGSAQYISNDEEVLLAESDAEGTITYSINGGPRKKQLDSAARKLLAEAVRIMASRGHNYN